MAARARRAAAPRFDPREDPEVQEALSRKYSETSMPVLRLSSGRYALFTRSFQLAAVGDWDELEKHYLREAG
jgi:hypothetical protein